ncbi:MAG: tetratricopeptide repeat protein [Candidatus Methanofastidiosum sp.]|nr:tetratricopeptide repeat protein [Methanofastidiosum sp.]
MDVDFNADAYLIEANTLCKNGYDLLNHKSPISLKKAINILEEALDIFSQLDCTGRCSEILNTLGAAYCAMAEYENSETNLIKSIEYLEEAIKLNNPSEFPLYHAMAQYNLGNTYRFLSELNDKDNNIKKALDSYKTAAKLTSKYYHSPSWEEQTFDTRLYEISQEAVKELKELLRKK